MTADPTAPAKIGALRELLSRSTIVHVTLDARAAGCVLPEHLRTDSQVTVNVGYDLRPRIPDLDLGAEALTCTLSFKGLPFHCTIPWHAVYAVHAGDLWACWPGSVPEDVQANAQPAAPPVLSAAEEKARRRAHLKLVP